MEGTFYIIHSRQDREESRPWTVHIELHWYILNFPTKRGNHHQNPTARSKSYWALGAQVPTQFPRLRPHTPPYPKHYDIFGWTGGVF